MGLDVYLEKLEPVSVHHSAITHNLGTMADKAGLYTHLWRPEEIGITKASQLIDPLTVGLQRLEASPDHFKQLNPKNGWGDYGGLVEFVKKYLAACIENPDADIVTSR